MRPILVVDDDPKIVQLLRAYLEREGYTVVTAGDGRAALAAIDDHKPRLIVLDLMLPEIDGMTVARQVRETSDVPILMLSARGSVANRIQGMAEGADDYLTKPFSPAELVVRVKAILRRSGIAPTRSTLQLADLDIDRDRHEVRRHDETVVLTTAEFRLLVALAEARGRVLSREALLDALYGQHGGTEPFDRTVDVYVGRLREKLGDDPERPRYVATVRGIGYRAVGTA